MSEYFYLRIDDRYAERLGGLRWASGEVAIEQADRSTFALGAELAAFIEGLASTGPVLHFDHVLHLLALLGRGKKAKPAWTNLLQLSFAKAGKNVANAGAFFGAVLDVPRASAKLDVAAIVRRLRGFPTKLVSPAWFDEKAPLTPEELESAVQRALDGLRPPVLEHWLRTGREPVEAVRVVETVERLPRSLDGALAAALRRPRLSGAVPFVAPLVSALALPRRRLSTPELPLGGYVDVTTRGGFDQILASQLVLEDLEFVRRFAANELLYYRREEPHKERREELVLLVDQGVRTWGFVRLVLAAACVALGKAAARRELPLLVATTKNGGALVDPVEADDESLAQLLEASDLTANPGLALERLLELDCEEGRDVVLLTHERSVTNPDVLAAARRARPGLRVFAVGVADDGAFALSELRHGAPLVRSRGRVDPLRAVEKAAAAPLPAIERPISGPWRGDAEPIGFPFRFGLTRPIGERCFDFDRAGEWVLVSGFLGALHLARTDGSRFELLPRGVVRDQTSAPLIDVKAVFGTSDGFVVAGATKDGRQVAVHYELAKHVVKTFVLRYAAKKDVAWFHFPELRSVVAKDDSACYAVDLDAGRTSERSKSACELVHAGKDGTERVAVELDSAGHIKLRNVSTCWRAFSPVADGRPELAGHVVLAACHANSVLALLSAPTNVETLTLRVFRAPDGTPLGAFETKPSGSKFQLSEDGQHLVREVGSSRVEVRPTEQPAPVFSFPTGRYHNDVRIELGAVWLRIHAGRHTHVVQWHGRVLRTALEAVPVASDQAEIIRRKPAFVEPPLHAYDPGRFQQALTVGVTAVVDVFGHVAILDRAAQRLLAVFFAYRKQIAAWMPDGTRYGSIALLEGPPTPGAAERLGHVLFEASVAAERAKS